MGDLVTTSFQTLLRPTVTKVSFLKLTGAINAGATQDEVVYWEEGRRHLAICYTSGNVDYYGPYSRLRHNVRDNDVKEGKLSRMTL